MCMCASPNDGGKMAEHTAMSDLLKITEEYVGLTEVVGFIS